jgi:hypothetical protein
VCVVSVSVSVPVRVCLCVLCLCVYGGEGRELHQLAAVLGSDAGFRQWRFVHSYGRQAGSLLLYSQVGRTVPGTWYKAACHHSAHTKPQCAAAPACTRWPMLSPTHSPALHSLISLTV